MWLVQKGFPCGSAGKESACSAGDLCLIPGLGRSTGEGKGYPLQYSGLENSMDCIVVGSQKVGHDQSNLAAAAAEGKQNQEIVEQHPKDIINAWDSDVLEARSASGIFSYMSP